MVFLECWLDFPGPRSKPLVEIGFFSPDVEVALTKPLRIMVI
ncbi:hypothetical protein [Candidatus Laterigemmans baculatus]|nr:hypothetical protein [Candidatus Laterigemmans baculatus]